MLHGLVEPFKEVPVAVQGHEGFLIYGQQDAGGPAIRAFDATIWISNDGSTWYKHPQSERPSDRTKTQM